jgi:transposase
MLGGMSLAHVQLGQPRRLAHLPLIMDVLRRSRVAEVIDAACGMDPRQKVSHGECVALIIAGVFAGEHGLWRLQDRLDVYDMATVMQDPGIDLAEYHDARLGRALDAIYDAGPDRIQTALALRAIDAWALRREYLHVDTTSLSFYGAYEEEQDEDWCPEVDGLGPLDAIPLPVPRTNAHASDPGYDPRDGDGRDSPLVVHGYAKNRRHDLKQILYGSVVTRDGGVPLYGRAMDGNTSDITAATEFLDHLRRSMISEPVSCFVADSKGWSPTVLAQVHDHRLRLLSRLPRSTMLARTCVADFDAAQAPCLLRRYDQRRERWSWLAYTGADAVYRFSRKRPVATAAAAAAAAGAAAGSTTPAETATTAVTIEEIELPVRVVTCFSSELFRQKAGTLGTIRKRERQGLAQRIRALERKRWRCAADAQAAADELIARQPLITMTLTPSVIRQTIIAKRTRRGRPRADEPAPQHHTVYRWTIATADASVTETDQRLRRAATYVLVRNRLPTWELPDDDMVAAYGQQWRVEHGFAWLKSGAAINPMYLESPRRIAALCMIYHIALMIHTLIQRAIRNGLQAQGAKLPYHRNKPSDQITARFLYELFRNVTTQTIAVGDEYEKRLHGDDEHTRQAIRAMQLSPDAYRPVIHDDEKCGAM